MLQFLLAGNVRPGELRYVGMQSWNKVDWEGWGGRVGETLVGTLYHDTVFGITRKER